MTVSRKQILFLVSHSERVQNLHRNYTTDVVVEEHEFAQNKDSGAEANLSRTGKTDKDGFMEVADGELPFD